MIKRLPLILFILTLISCGFMILIRIGGSGVRLLSAKTGTGRFIAACYNPCIIVFIVILCAFIIVTAVLSRNRKKRKGIKHGTPAAAEPEPALPEGYYPETPHAGYPEGTVTEPPVQQETSE